MNSELTPGLNLHRSQPLLRLPLEVNRRNLFYDLNLGNYDFNLFDDISDTNFNANNNINMNKNNFRGMSWQKVRNLQYQILLLNFIMLLHMFAE